MMRILCSDWLHDHLARSKNILKLADFPTRHFQTTATRNYLTTVEPFLWDTFIQRSPPFKGHELRSRKSVHMIFVFVTSIEGTPLFRGKGHFFWVPKPRFNHTLALTTKIVDKFKCLLSKWRQLSKHELCQLKSLHCSCGNSVHNIADKSI